VAALGSPSARWLPSPVRAAYAGLRRRPRPVEKTWTRTNHRGELVTLARRPRRLRIGAITAELVCAAGSPLLTRAWPWPRRGRPGVWSHRRSGRARVSVAASAATWVPWAHGEVTHRHGQARGAGRDRARRRGLRYAASRCHRASSGATAPGRATDVLDQRGPDRGGANLLNLFDLRPGRAIRIRPPCFPAAWIARGQCRDRGPESSSGGRAAGLVAVAAPLGASLALLPEDLGERAMLGDARCQRPRRRCLARRPRGHCRARRGSACWPASSR